MLSTTTKLVVGSGWTRAGLGRGATIVFGLTSVRRMAVVDIHTSVYRFRPITPPPPPPSPAQPAKCSTRPTPASQRPNVSPRPTAVRSKPLPSVPNTLPLLLTIVTLALSSWAAFTVYATNKEKLSSSIFKSIVSQVKASPEIASLLSSSDRGGIVLKRETWLGGMPRVQGSVNMMQGRVDLAFKIHPVHNQDRTATVYFTSIRASKKAPFEIVRFVVVDDSSGDSTSLLHHARLTSIDVESGDLV